MDNKLKNLRISGDQIETGTINGFNVKNGSLSSLKVNDFVAKAAQIAVAEIASAQIDVAQIENLSAHVANITMATIQDADIEWANIASLTTAIAYVALAEIETARIGFTQIDGVTAGTALITEMLGGKVAIADLSVTDANIVELNANKINAGTLSVERLIIVGSDKSIVYAINELNGTPQLSQSTIDGGSITRKTITADNIVAGSITATEIASRSITGNEILAGSITANEIGVGTITGINIASLTIDGGHIKAGTLTTNHMSSDFGETLNLSSNTGINQQVSKIYTDMDTLVENIKIGGRNYARETGTARKNTIWSGVAGQRFSLYNVDFSRDWLVGDTITLSFDCELTDVAWAGGALFVQCRAQGNITGWPTGSISNTVYEDANISGDGVSERIRIVYRRTLTADQLENTRWVFELFADHIISGTISVSNFKLESGDKATDWTPAPEDIDKKITDSIPEVGGVNLINKSENYTLIGDDTNTFWMAANELTRGANYTFSIHEIVKDAGIAAGVTWALIDTDTLEAAEMGTLELTYGRQIRRFTVPDTGANWGFALYAGIYDATNGVTVTFSKAQLEEGDIATSWRAAASDISNKVDEASDAIFSLDAEMDLRVQGIIRAMGLEKQFADSEEFLAWIGQVENIKSQLIQSDESFTMAFDRIIASEGEIEKIMSHIVFGVADGSPYIDMSTSESIMKMRLTNTRLAFVQGALEVAYFSDNKLYVTQLEVKERMSIGTSANGFLDIVTTPTGVGFKWRT